MPTSFDFDGKTVLITGAGSGIGRALALNLAHQGVRLALADRDEASLGETRARLPFGVVARTYRLDVTDVAAIRQLPATIKADFGGLDVLINNAGIALGGTFEQVSEEDFAQVVEVNFWGIVRMTRAFLPLLKASPDARLVNLSSLFGLISPPGQAAYSASKFAVRGFSNALAVELLDTSVGVTVVHPGGVATSIASSSKTPDGLSEAEIALRRAEMQKLLKLPPERAAAIIVDGVRRRKRRVLVGSDAKLAALLERLAPVRHLSILSKLLGAERPK
jgi:NAD(P)-dependent dehydrogenase (short-subunit alcohol dehydrogenase family)